MANTYKNGLLARAQHKISMEQQEEERRISENFDPENMVENTEVETQLIEDQARTEEVEVLDDELQRADGEFQSMESLLYAVECFSHDKGMDAHSAVLFNLALEGIHNRLGIEYLEEDYIALEGFDGPSSRQSATLIALEDQSNKLKDWIMQSYEWIKELIRKAVSAFKEYFKASNAISKRATALLASAKKLNEFNDVGENMARRASEMFGGYSSVSDGMTFLAKMAGGLADKKLFKDIDNHNYELKMVISHYTRSQGDILSGDQKRGWLSRIGKALGGGYSKSDVERVLTQDDNLFSPSFKLLRDEKAKTAVKSQWGRGDSGVYRYIGDHPGGGHGTRFLLPDNYAFIAHLDIEDASGENRQNNPLYVPSLAMTFIKLDGYSEKSNAEKFKKAPSGADIKKILESVKELSGYHDKISSAATEFAEKFEKDLSEIADIVAKYKPEESSGSDEKQGFRERMGNMKTTVTAFIRKAFTRSRTLASAMTAPFNKFLTYINRTSKFAMDYCAVAITGQSIASKAGDKATDYYGRAKDKVKGVFGKGDPATAEA